jgi:hypothetical protein
VVRHSFGAELHNGLVLLMPRYHRCAATSFHGSAMLNSLAASLIAASVSTAPIHLPWPQHGRYPSGGRMAVALA